MTPPTLADWLLLFLAAWGVGLSKSGLAGVGLVHVLIFAWVFGARASTGILLPLLIVGDVGAVTLVGRDAVWKSIQRLMPPAWCGIIIGWFLLDRLVESQFRVVIGTIILLLSIGQAIRMWRPLWMAHVPHASWFVIMIGVLTGVTTMLANAAGPIVALYLLAIGLPKHKLVATGSWFFLIVNLSKVPFSTQLGLIDSSTLLINLSLAPMVLIGLGCGRWVVRKIPQRIFDSLLLAFTAFAALRLIGIF